MDNIAKQLTRYDEILELVRQPISPFYLYYQQYICEIQDELISQEISHYETTIAHKTIDKQLDAVAMLLKDL